MLHFLPVLMYHSISRFNHYLCVPPERFESHCRTLAEAGWRGISLEEAEDHFLRKKRLPRKTCLFTFDDGYFDNYVHAEPLLRQYGHHGVIFPVLDFVEETPGPRKNRETLAADPGLQNQLALLDKRVTGVRSGRRVAKILFCSWSELRQMREQGNMSAAPHSMDHGRAVVSLEIRGIYPPLQRSGFFAVPPHEIPYGFPRFRLGHALADRSYRLNPKLFDLIRSLVPQTPEEAKQFLDAEPNRKALIKAVLDLPELGTLETEEEYRKRVAGELQRCRDVFTEKTGRAPVSFCWPWGSYNRIALREARRAGFRLFFATSDLPCFLSRARAVYRITVRGQTPAQLLTRIQLESGAVATALWKMLRKTDA